MADSVKCKGTIGILTGGGDVPGLNPAIRAITVRALRDGYRVIGIRRGWAGLIEIERDKKMSENGGIVELTEDIVNRIGRSGGTFLHTSRTKPSHVPWNLIPQHLTQKYPKPENEDEKVDLTPEVLLNLEYLGIDILIPIGGDDTLSYAEHLSHEGMRVIAIPKTMDNDVPGTDYCIGFSTCVTRTIEMTHALRTSAGSHERILVLEVFGRYAGYTALLPTMAGAANRCVIPEHKFDLDLLTELLVYDRGQNPSNYSVVLISEGAMMGGQAEMSFEGTEADMFGHRKLGGIGEYTAASIKEKSAQYNNSHRIDVIFQKLGYLVRCGHPDSVDAIVPMAFGNIAMDLITQGATGRLVCLRRGAYDHVPLNIVTSTKKVLNVSRHYDTERLRPIYHDFLGSSIFIMTSLG
ncbi:MAG: 6-phosphofructokinase [Candidatus Scalindua sp.]